MGWGDAALLFSSLAPPAGWSSLAAEDDPRGAFFIIDTNIGTFFCYNGNPKVAWVFKNTFLASASTPQSDANSEHTCTGACAILRLFSIRKQSAPLLPPPSPLLIRKS